MSVANCARLLTNARTDNSELESFCSPFAVLVVCSCLAASLSCSSCDELTTGISVPSSLCFVFFGLLPGVVERCFASVVSKSARALLGFASPAFCSSRRRAVLSPLSSSCALTRVYAFAFIKSFTGTQGLDRDLTAGGVRVH